jgi:hypothetical protein|uniref:Uncharacterized protein n=1 Tax=Zea mays TaxID=4577 RepID=A0A804LM97_MAIZE
MSSSSSFPHVRRRHTQSSAYVRPKPNHVRESSSPDDRDAAPARRRCACGAAARRRVEPDQERQRPAHPGARRLGGDGARQAGQRRAAVRRGDGRRGAGGVRDELQARPRRHGRRRQGRGVRGLRVRAVVDQHPRARVLRAGQLTTSWT